jgi:hypothetical protein
MSDYNNLLYKIKKYRSYLNSNPNSHSFQNKLNKYTNQLNAMRGGGRPINDGVEATELNPSATYMPNQPTVLYNTKTFADLVEANTRLTKGTERDTFLNEYFVKNPSITDDKKSKLETDFKKIEVQKLLNDIDEKLVSEEAYSGFYNDVKTSAEAIKLRLDKILERIKVLYTLYVKALVDVELTDLGAKSSPEDCEEKLRNLITVINEYIEFRAKIQESRYDIQATLNKPLEDIEKVLGYTVGMSGTTPTSPYKVPHVTTGGGLTDTPLDPTLEAGAKEEAMNIVGTVLNAIINNTTTFSNAIVGVSAISGTGTGTGTGTVTGFNFEKTPADSNFITNFKAAFNKITDATIKDKIQRYATAFKEAIFNKKSVTDATTAADSAAAATPAAATPAASAVAPATPAAATSAASAVAPAPQAPPGQLQLFGGNIFERMLNYKAYI